MIDMEETRTTLVQAFENCAARRAAFQTAVVSARGNIDDPFFAFHGAFSMLYNLALPNTGVMDSVCEDGKTLATTINEWIVNAKSYKSGARGGRLFETLVAALADAGLV